MRPLVAIQAIVFFSILWLLYRYYDHHSHLPAVTEAYSVTEIAIPQTVHQLLLSMPDHPISHFEPSDHVISWQQSGWKVEYWSEEACRELARDVDASGTLADAFEKLPYAVLQSDFCRYLVLFGRGGVYSDLDVHLFQPLPWTVMGSSGEQHHSPPNVIIGLEGDATTQGLPRSPQFVQWTMASTPLHPMFRDLLSRIAERTPSFVEQVHALEGDAEVNVMDWTGPSVWTDTILDYLSCSEEQVQHLRDLKDPVRIRDVMILPKRSFAVTQGEDHTLPDVLVKHYFSGTWKTCKSHWPGWMLPWIC